MSRAAVFVDRDGTLIEESGYLNDLSRLIFFPYTVDAVRQLNRGGFAVVVITNQAGIARGIVPEAFVDTAHRHIQERMRVGGAQIDAFYYCPHHPDGRLTALSIKCECRKPEPGLLLRAARELDLDLDRSFMIGDRFHDLEAGRTAGAKTVLVRTGYGATEERAQDPARRPHAVADNIAGAAAWILQNRG